MCGKGSAPQDKDTEMKSYIRQEGPMIVANAEVNLAGTGFTTDDFDMSGYDAFRVDVAHTWVAATHVLYYIEYRVNGAWFRLQSGSVAAGTDTSSAYTVSKATGGASVNYGRRHDSEYEMVHLVFDSTGGTTDIDTVYITKSYGGK